VGGGVVRRKKRRPHSEEQRCREEPQATLSGASSGSWLDPCGHAELMDGGRSRIAAIIRVRPVADSRLRRTIPVR
jgi:hypothetical protein